MTDQILHMDLSKALDEMKDIIEGLNISKEVVNAAMARAINRTMVTVRTRIIREVSSDLQVKQGLIKKRGQLRKASASRPSSRFTLYAYSIPAVLLNWRETKRGVKVGKRKFPIAFHQGDVKRQRGKRRGMILERKGRGRHPLFERRIGMLEEAIESFKVSEDFVVQTLTKNLLHELRFRGGLLG